MDKDDLSGDAWRSKACSCCGTDDEQGGDQIMAMYTVKRMKGGWSVHDHVEDEDFEIPDGAVITYEVRTRFTGPEELMEVVGSKTGKLALVAAVCMMPCPEGVAG